MQTLSYGFKKPEDGDKGDAVFTALEENIQRTNDHTHNGVNSAPIDIAFLTKYSQDVPAASWGSPVDGLYSTIVSMVGGLQFDTATVTIRETSTGKLMSLSYEKVSANSFRVYCNDPTKDITILYA